MTFRMASGIAGILTGLAAAGVGLFYPTKAGLIIVLSVISLLLLLSFFFLRSLKTFAGRRATQLGLNSLLMVVFFIFIAVMINLIVSQYYFRLDLSSTRKFTLSPQTENVVKDLEQELSILAFVRGSSIDYDTALTLLDGYRYMNRKIITNVYDLDAVPSLAQRYGVDAYNNAVIVFGEKHIKIGSISEGAITNGIIRVTRKEKRPVYFVTGHGEHSLNDQGRRGLSKAVESLDAMGYEVRSLNLASIQHIPFDASIVVVAGPEIVMSEHESEVLEQYSKEGNVLLMLNREGDHMGPFLERFGVSFYEGLAADPVNKMAGSDETVPLVSSYPPSPVTEDFDLTTVYPTAMGLKAGKFGAAFRYIPIVNSSDSSYVRLSVSPDGSGDSIEGPIVLSELITQRDRDGLVVIFGDSDFVTNDYYDVSGNGNLFRNVINYLAGEKAIVSISPQVAGFVPLYITSAQSNIIMYVFMVGFPLLVALVGFVLWMARKRL